MPTAPRRGLVVIDVQNDDVSGGLPIEYPPVAQSLANIAQAMDAAQAAGVPVVVVQNDAPADSPIFATGSPGWQLHPAVPAARTTSSCTRRCPAPSPPPIWRTGLPRTRSTR